MKRLLRCAFIVMAVSTGAARAGTPPSLDLVMTPHPAEDGGYIGVAMTLEAPQLEKGEGLVRLPLTLVGIPTARYDSDALTASDDKGPLPLFQEEEPPTPQGVYRRWTVGRATEGDVVIRYNAPPRKVTAATNNGPLFDLRAEAGGFAGAGVGFIATPAEEGLYAVSLKWDMSDAPEGSFGTWSFGEGDTQAEIAGSALSFSYYAAGPLKRFPPKGEESKFALYWLAEPPFDIKELAARIETLYGAMSSFFNEDQSSYRVFMRENPYDGRGGSALSGSFMFGYNREDAPTVDDLQSLVAHEMAHNWPAMQGEHGMTAWYSEGNAEFYSLLLAYRAGLMTTDEYLEEINERAAGYYANPYRALSNEEAGQKFWTDPTAQTVPYGRGFMYLVQTDGAIRAKTKGKRSLDDIVREMRRRQKSGEAYGIAEWLSLVGAEIGDKAAKAQYEAMASGDLLLADDRRFAPCFEVVSEPVRPFELGFARSSLNDARIVKDLDPQSEAARLGLREGDHIVEVDGLNETRKDETAKLTLTISRPEGDQTISYLPRGDKVEGYQWARNEKASDSACKF